MGESDAGGTSAAHRIVQLETVEVSLFSTNCYVVKAASGEVAVVDPGGNPERIAALLEAVGGTVRYILCTHGHLDHVEAAGALKDTAGGEIVLHRDDLPLWDRIAQQAQMFLLPEPPALPAPDIILDGETPLTVGPVTVHVRHVPGHSPGSVTYLFPEEGIVFNGDTVFAMGVGRTDLWAGDAEALRNSVEEKLFSLADDVILYPGHGPPVSVKEARRNRPLLAM